MEAGQRRIALNTVLLSATELLTLLVSLVLVIFVARRLGPEMMGIYAFALTFIGLFDIFVNFGLERYIQREVGRAPDLAGPLFSQVFGLKLLIFLLSAVIMLLAGLLLIDPGVKRWIVWILGLSLFFRANIASSTAFFRARQQAQYEALVVISFRLVYGGTGLAAILSGQGLITLASLELVAQAGACLLSWWLFIKKIGNPFYRIRWDSLLKLGKSTKDFLLIRIVLTAFSSINVLMLSMMASDVAIGFYSAAARLSSAFDFLPGAFTGAFLPFMSRQKTESWNAFAEVFRYYFKYLLIVGLGLAAVLAGTAEGFIRVIFGSSYKPAILTLTILGLTLAMDFANLSLSNALIALDEEWKIARIFVAAAAANIVLNLFLLPAYQQNGAAGASFISEILILFLLLRALGWGRVRNLGLMKVSARPVLAGLLVFAFARWWLAWNLNFFIGLIVTGLVFLASLVLTGALTRNELAAGRELLRLKKRVLEEG